MVIQAVGTKFRRMSRVSEAAEIKSGPRSLLRRPQYTRWCRRTEVGPGISRQLIRVGIAPPQQAWPRLCTVHTCWTLPVGLMAKLQA